jgi:hypothetical protein
LINLREDFRGGWCAEREGEKSAEEGGPEGADESHG